MSTGEALVVDTTLPDSSGSVKLRMSKDFRSRHWSYLFETLRRTVDAIYDTCQADRNIFECKEAVIILRNYYHDFEKLIERLQVEEAWEKSDRPTAVAWEIRKTMGSPTKVPQCQFSPIALPNLANGDRALTPASCKSNQPDDPIDSSKEGGLPPIKTEIMQSTSDPLDPVKSNETEKGEPEDDGWSVVRYGKSRRTDNKGVQRKGYGDCDSPDEPITNYMNPRSAMDIPQTRASLAKMAHSRKLLWANKQPLLEEMMQARRRAEYRNLLKRQKGGSLPSINRIGINFKDPTVVSITAQKFNAQQLAAKTRGQNVRNVDGKCRKTKKYRHMQSTESLYSLESIHEVDETNRPKSQTGEVSESCISTPRSEHPETPGTTPELPGSPFLNPGFALQFFWEGPIDTTSLPVSRSFCGWSGMEEEEYKQLTEEEESLALEEESLQKAYREEEMKSIDAEIERQLQDSAAPQVMDLPDSEDQAETEDNEVADEPSVHKEVEQVPEEDQSCQSTAFMPFADVMERWTAEHNLLSKVSWAELVNMELSMVELSDIRAPGDAAKMHEKLSSPSRKRVDNDAEDALKRHEERLAKAEYLRHELQNHKTNRMRELSSKVEEVRKQKEAVTERKRQLLDTKMARAAENRENVLQAVVKKARNEDDKVQETAFYNYLEAGNRRNDALAKHQEETEHVKQNLAKREEERLRKVNEKAAKEAAAEERRKLAAEERTCRLRDLAEKKRVRSMQVQMQKCEQEKERVQAAREKSKERKERLADIKAAQLANSQELKSRISHKQEETSRRYEENLVQIKLRASEMSTPRLPVGSVQCEHAPDSRPMHKPQFCTVCNIMLESELIMLAHVISASHREAIKDNDTVINPGLSDTVVDAKDDQVADSDNKASEERKTNEKAHKLNFKRKKQKLKQKISSKVKEYDSTVNLSKCGSQNIENGRKSKMSKLCDEVNSLVRHNPMQNMWLDKETFSFDRAVGEMTRTLTNNNDESSEQMMIWTEGAGDSILSLLNTVLTPCVPVPLRTLANAATVLIKSVLKNRYVCVELFYSNRLSILIELLTTLLKTKLDKDEETCSYVSIACILSSCIANIVTTLNTLAVHSTFWDCLPEKLDGYLLRTSLYSNYVVLLGFVDVMKFVVENTYKDGSDSDSLAQLLNPCLYMLVVFTDSASLTSLNNGSSEGCGSVVYRLKETRLCGLVSCIYESVVQPAWSVQHDKPPFVTEQQASLSLATFVLFNRLATADRCAAQSLVTGDWPSLQFRYICCFLLRVCDKGSVHVSLLQQVLIAIAHFVSLNPENQNVVNCMPTYILNEICALPASFLSDYKLKKVLLPTLIACCFNNTNNRRQLEKCIPSSKLAQFIQEEIAQREQEPQNLLKLNIFEFSVRFPYKMWDEAHSYFISELEETN